MSTLQGNKKMCVYLNNRALKSGRQKLQGEIEKSTIILQHLSFSKNIVNLNSTINQTDLIDFYRILYPATTEYVFFPNSHRTFAKTNHILGHKTYLTKFSLLYSTGNSSQYSVMAYMGKESKKSGYMYMYKIHFVVHLKLTQHLKSTILQEKFLKTLLYQIE